MHLEHGAFALKSSPGKESHVQWNLPSADLEHQQTLHGKTWSGGVLCLFTCFLCLCVDFALSGINQGSLLGGGVYTLETPIFNHQNNLLVIALLKVKEVIACPVFGLTQSW